MLAAIDYLHTLLRKDLDEYLERGWFRMGQNIFTTNFLRFNDIMYSALWLKIDLNKYEPTATQQKLLKQNAHFRSEIKPVDITPQHDALYEKYKTSISFNNSPTLYDKLFDESSLDIFDSLEINLYDHENLIATGYFDLGESSAEGIACYYDPDYKKNSLGKYLMLLKLLYCQEKGFRYFYPGYFAPGYAMFDYKLKLSKPEAMSFLNLADNQWTPIAEFSTEHNHIEVMTRKLQELNIELSERNIVNNLLYYSYYDANLMRSMQGHTLFDYPVFVYCYGVDARKEKVVAVYDVRKSEYQLLFCLDLFEAPYLNEDSTYKTNIFFSLKCIAAAAEASDMAEVAGRVVWE